MKKNIFEFSPEEIKQILSGWQKEPFRAEQIFAWLYKKPVSSFSDMSNLTKELRQLLGDNFVLGSLKLQQAFKSIDSCEKLILKTQDGAFIENVLIPSRERVTGCISTQVGCKFYCNFCASGRLGFKRNLSAAEIIEQIRFLKARSQDARLTHLVYMGTGEPLDNYDNVIKSIRAANSPSGFNIGARRITISTCGLIPQIKKLEKENLQVELSVSLHAADDLTRSDIMPINKKYPLADLIKACKEYSAATSRQVTFEYVLIKGKNCDMKSAKNLSKILKGYKLSKVNLIPLNLVAGSDWQPPEKSEILNFKNYLSSRKIRVTLRKGRGSDIRAACGQLRLEYEKK